MRSLAPRPPRGLRRLSLLAVIPLLSTVACVDRAVAPDRGPATASLAQSTSSEFDAFLQAQGSFCGSVNLPCDPIYGDIGYILSLGETGGDAFMTIDAWGVNARWFPRHFPAISPAYDYDGTIAEHRMVDGSRRITAHVRGRNTFVELYTANGSVLGADLFAYGQVPPVLGDADATVELIVPGDYVGYPDIMRIAYDPEPGTSLLRYTLHESARGITRQDFQGIPAGTLVTASISATWLPRHVNIKGKATGLRRNDFAPGVVLRVKAVP